MEDIVPRPLRVVKTSQPDSQHELRSVSQSSYPSIPCRKSSLHAAWRQFSNDSADSTTPPSSVDPGPINVRKNRVYTRSSWQNRGQTLVKDITNSDEIPSEKVSRNNKSEKQIVPRFFSGWSFRSWSSTMRRLSLDQANNSNDPNPAGAFGAYNCIVEKRPKPITYPQNSSGYGKGDILTSTTIPITGISLKTIANSPIIGTGPDSVWATVDISAEVGSSDSLNHGSSAPLDIIILLDSIPHTHMSMLRQAAISSLAIASALTGVDDRFSIAYIDKDLADGYGLLLPLGMHSLDSARAAVDTFSLHQLTGKRAGKVWLQGVISRVSNILYLPERSAGCHVFFITATPSVQLSTPVVDKRIGFHTISPHFRFPLIGTNISSGWHIFHDIDSYDADSKEFVLRDKISTAIDHIRIGVQPGAVTDLKLSLFAGDRCQVQVALEETYLDILRPGEKWVIPVQVNVPAASIRQPLQITDGNWVSGHPALDKVMIQLQDLLTDFSHEDITQQILSARLEYKHSLLPVDNTVYLESSCTVLRDVHEFRIVSLDT